MSAAVMLVTLNITAPVKHSLDRLFEGKPSWRLPNEEAINRLMRCGVWPLLPPYEQHLCIKWLAEHGPAWPALPRIDKAFENAVLQRGAYFSRIGELWLGQEIEPFTLLLKNQWSWRALTISAESAAMAVDRAKERGNT
jgi:hypothetical protein